MKKSVKTLIKTLPGPNSYCNCNSLCSPITVDHVIPKKILKDNVSSYQFKKSINDMHNLYKCCTKLNQKKAYKLLEHDYVLSNYLKSEDEASYHTAYLSRAALYMQWKYSLLIDKNIIKEWKRLAILTPPHRFEIKRNKIISNKQGDSNIYIHDNLYIQDKNKLKIN